MIYWQVFIASFLSLLLANLGTTVKTYGWVLAMVGCVLLGGVITSVFWLLGVVGLFGGV